MSQIIDFDKLTAAVAKAAGEQSQLNAVAKFLGQAGCSAAPISHFSMVQNRRLNIYHWTAASIKGITFQSNGTDLKRDDLLLSTGSAFKPSLQFAYQLPDSGPGIYIKALVAEASGATSIERGVAQRGVKAGALAKEVAEKAKAKAEKAKKSTNRKRKESKAVNETVDQTAEKVAKQRKRARGGTGQPTAAAVNQAEEQIATATGVIAETEKREITPTLVKEAAAIVAEMPTNASPAMVAHVTEKVVAEHIPVAEAIVEAKAELPKAEQTAPAMDDEAAAAAAFLKNLLG